MTVGRSEQPARRVRKDAGRITGIELVMAQEEEVATTLAACLVGRLRFDVLQNVMYFAVQLSVGGLSVLG